MHWASLGPGREGAGASQKAASRGGKGGAGESKEIAIYKRPACSLLPLTYPRYCPLRTPQGFHLFPPCTFYGILFPYKEILL